jgi:hypothetical protein
MTREEAIAILQLPKEEAITVILALSDKAEKYDQLCGKIGPTRPSGMTPVYEKGSAKKRRRKPGQKKGHPGIARPKPAIIHHYNEHTLDHCPECQKYLGSPVKSYKRYTEDIPPVEPEVTEHTVHGYWCSCCKKIVYGKVTDALPHAALGLRVVVFTAWLHYLCGLSVNHIVSMLRVFANFRVSPGGLTQAWQNLSITLKPLYDEIGKNIRDSAVLNADETGWRLNGITYWLWCFATKKICYYTINKSRGSPVIKRVLGKIFKGILICDFWGAYNKICTMATQRCFFHLFTELNKTDKHHQSLEWRIFRKKLYRLLQDAVRLSVRKEQLTKDIFQRRKQMLYNRLEELIDASWKDKHALRLKKRLNRHRHELFTFLEFDGVSPYNNHAEQQMRKPVNTRKISYQNRSGQGAETHAILMSLFRSAELQQLNPVEWVYSQTQTIIDPNNKAIAELKMAA